MSRLPDVRGLRKSVSPTVKGESMKRRAGAGLTLEAQEDDRAIPADLAAIGTGELKFPLRSHRFYLDWFYGADLELREKSGSLHIRKGKGFKERRTSIPLPARKTLHAWLELYKGLDVGFDKEAPLFIRLRGKPAGRLSIRAIQDMVSEAGKRARIDEAVTPHILRHTCAFMLRKSGVDIETRAKMLGHSIETASKYGAPGESEIEKAASLLDHAEAA